MIVEVPQQKILYVPKFWQVLKFAWIKYFSLLMFFYVLLHHFFLNYILTGGVFETVQTSEIDLKRVTRY
jgi:hypothetical protein